MAVTSGKGGVGKTNVVAGLAISLAKAGQRAVVLDADFGLANLDILLGLSPRFTLEHVLRGDRVLEEIVVEGPCGIRVIPASSGIHELTRLDAAQELRLVQGLQRIATDTDWLLIDTAAGVHDSVVRLLMAAQEVILVGTPEPTSLIDVYAMVKVVSARDPAKPIWLLVNNAQGEEEAMETIEWIQAASREFLGREVWGMGAIPSDAHVPLAVREQGGVADLFPDSPAARAFRAMSRILVDRVPLQKDGVRLFWEKLIRA
jgi:flagellar biosynthesis protein FlhG